jgi:hypothetical protein
MQIREVQNGYTTGHTKRALPVIYHQNPRNPMNAISRTKAILTDTHFLIPVVVFCLGLALLIVLH